MTTFTKKDLRFTFVLSNNAVFDVTGNNTLKVNGLRAAADIKGAGMPAFPEAELTIFGLKQEDMNALTALAFSPDGMQRNTVTVEADSGQGFSTVFSGQMITSGPDYSGIPQAPLKVFARVLGFDSLNPAAPTSYTGTVDVATIVQNLATAMGFGTIENNGVNIQLSSSYFSGTLADQLRAVKQHANIQVYFDGDTLAICPAGGVRSQPAFTLTPQSGLIGYPKLDFQRGYVYVKALYNPAFRFGGPITIQGSDVPLANGSWTIGTITNNLSSLMPNGPWFSNMLLYPTGNPPPTS